jgi:hypothetical protein
MKKFKIKGNFEIEKELGVTFEDFEDALQSERIKEALKWKYLYGQVNPRFDGKNLETISSIEVKHFRILGIKTFKETESFEITVEAVSIDVFDQFLTASKDPSIDMHAAIRSLIDMEKKQIIVVTFDIIIKKLEQSSVENQLRILVSELSEAEEEMKKTENKLKELGEEQSKLKDLIKTKKKEIDKLMKEKVKLDKNNKESK